MLATWRLLKNTWRSIVSPSFSMRSWPESWTSAQTTQNITSLNIWKQLRNKSHQMPFARRFISSKTLRVASTTTWCKRTSSQCLIAMMSLASRVCLSLTFAKHSKLWESRMPKRFSWQDTQSYAKRSMSTRFHLCLSSKKSITDLATASKSEVRLRI